MSSFLRTDFLIWVTGIHVPAFTAPDQLQGQEAEIVAALVDALDRALAGMGLVFTTDKPAAGDYSTVFVGGDGSAFAELGSLIGLRE